MFMTWPWTAHPKVSAWPWRVYAMVVYIIGTITVHRHKSTNTRQNFHSHSQETLREMQPRVKGIFHCAENRD